VCGLPSVSDGGESLNQLRGYLELLTEAMVLGRMQAAMDVTNN